VVKDQVARNLSGNIYPSRDPYLFSASASLVKAENMASVKQQILDAIENFKTSQVSDAILKETKDRVRYSFAMSMDSPDAIANSVSLYIWVTGDPNAINRSYELFESVTPQDLQRVAKKYLVPDAMTVATISPDDKPGLE
jgi:zinc protease